MQVAESQAVMQVLNCPFSTPFQILEIFVRAHRNDYKCDTRAEASAEMQGES